MSGENLYFFLALLAAPRSRTNVYEKFLLSARVEWGHVIKSTSIGSTWYKLLGLFNAWTGSICDLL